MRKTLLAGVSLVLTLSACATVAPTDQVASRAALAPRPLLPGAGCVSATATRLPVKPGDCVGFGQSYSQADLIGTGQLEVGPALRMLDPAITVHGR